VKKAPDGPYCGDHGYSVHLTYALAKGMDWVGALRAVIEDERGVLQSNFCHAAKLDCNLLHPALSFFLGVTEHVASMILIDFADASHPIFFRKRVSATIFTGQNVVEELVTFVRRKGARKLLWFVADLVKQGQSVPVLNKKWRDQLLSALERLIRRAFRGDALDQQVKNWAKKAKEAYDKNNQDMEEKYRNDLSYDTDWPRWKN